MTHITLNELVETLTLILDYFLSCFEQILVSGIVIHISQNIIFINLREYVNFSPV